MKRHSKTGLVARPRSAALSLKGESPSLKVDAVIDKTVHENREIWRVSSNGQIKNIATTASSTAAMDEAVEIYGRALERLANR
jgi:hypothetical protein